MKFWFVSMGIVSAVGVLMHFFFARDSMEHFIAGYLFGAPLGVLFVRVLLNKWIKPEPKLQKLVKRKEKERLDTMRVKSGGV